MTSARPSEATPGNAEPVVSDGHARPATSLSPHSSPLTLSSQRLGSRVVSVLDSGAEEPGFKSQLRRYRVTVLGKLFTPIASLVTKQRN